MSYWEKVITRLSVPGIILITAGIVLFFQSGKVSQWIFREKAERAALPVKLLGLLLAVFGALILLDFIPGW